jgi:hypothetical protein
VVDAMDAVYAQLESVIWPNTTDNEFGVRVHEWSNGSASPQGICGEYWLLDTCGDSKLEL